MTKNTYLRRAIVWSVTASLLSPGSLLADVTDISNEPLAQPASSVKPNIMLIFDDSGSMKQQYTPDYLGRFPGVRTSNPFCFDAKDSGGTITGGLDNCEAGDPPLMSPDINTQYYNPEIRYFPAVRYDGTAMDNMDRTRTTAWTAVPTDAVSASSVNDFRRDTLDMNGSASQVDTVDLVSGYPDRVWCDAQAASATDTARCKTNSAYSYPSHAFGYGLTSGGAIKYKLGAPYYYRLAATEYCTDSTLTNCTAASSSTGSYTVPAQVRYCTDSTLTNCQAKYKSSGTPTYTYPKFLGNVNPGTAGSGGTKASATLTVRNPQRDTAGGTITGVYINGINVLTSNITLGSSFTASSAATNIASAINAHADYDATASSNVVTITAAAVGATPNGYALTASFNVTSTTSATSSIEISNTSNGDSIATFVVGSLNLLPGGSIVCSSCGTSSGSRNSYMASQLAAAINASGTGYSATSLSGETFTLVGPAGSGSSLNGLTPTTSSPGMTVSRTAFSGGITAGDVDLTTTSFSGGSDPIAFMTPFRQNVGNFSRVDLVPYLDPSTGLLPKTFTKYTSRTDCAGSSCTYDEEMTNFANWYAYYRSRAQMAKTSIGRAFAGLTDLYRVGFITINPMGDLSGRFLAVDDFASGSGSQKDNWYQKLYLTGMHGGTPLREALSRVGRYYGNVQTGINAGMPGTPIQTNCQPNYAILTTDGYWNGNPGRSLTDTGTGSTGGLGNHDNVDSGYSKRSEARYDGGLAGATNTLADVALYYYKTDLSSRADQVPVTARDPAPHQHMTTFTVGLGLAGQLTYAHDYESGGSPDFERLKTPPGSGGMDWPVPVADTETALDDLWHAAVNGRGTFFSARDPVQLADAIGQTLNSVSSRVGAGAAAATSNLQPVAGDNFAFTAQYQTVDWIGDLQAKTIDLSNGNVAFASLWSAQALLELRTHENRNIYTFDASDTGGNRLKSFCSPATIGLYSACNDGTGLTATEMGWFEPVTGGPSGWTRLAQAGSWPADLTGRAGSATKEKVVDYLRGDRVNEMATVSSTGLTDLFRKRTKLLGDIINAQPAYVKAAQFGYNSGLFAGRDPFYVEFKNTTNGVSATRKGTVFSASNDGMLHAFETDPDNNAYYQTAGISTATTTDDAFTGTLNTSALNGEGAERWAYIPSMLIPNLLRLAEYPYTHRYYTDGSPVVGDVCFDHTTSTPCSAPTNWRTVLVAGLNAGGRGYYALDVTEPDSPKALWEFKGGADAACIANDADVDGSQTGDCHLGLSFGNPLIVKRKSDGRWVVLFTSGYNNVSPGDGKGHLYVVDAKTGRLLQRLSTPIGCDGASTSGGCTAGTVDPSGLGKINAWVDEAYFDNTALTVYGGDLKGNLWRFQFENTTDVPANSVTLLAQVKGPGNIEQSITTRPELGLVNNKRVIYVGTGRFLGSADLGTEDRQSIYAIKDAMSTSIVGSPAVAITRSGSFPTSTIAGFVRQDLALSTDGNTRTVSTSSTVDFTDATVFGWFIDLPDGGSGTSSERVNVDPILQLGTLVVPSNVPSNDTCVAGGHGWINFLDYRSGTVVPGASGGLASTKITSSLVVGINVVQLPGGTVKTIVTTADNQQLTRDTPVAPSNLSGRRISWRELFLEQ